MTELGGGWTRENSVYEIPLLTTDKCRIKMLAYISPEIVLGLVTLLGKSMHEILYNTATLNLVIPSSSTR